jgi:hypothetical protein
MTSLAISPAAVSSHHQSAKHVKTVETDQIDWWGINLPPTLPE